MAKKGAIKLDFIFNAKQNVASAFNQVAKNFEDINRKGDEMREGFEDLNTQMQKLATVGQKGFQMMTQFLQESIDKGAQFDFIFAQMRGTIKGLGLATADLEGDLDSLRNRVFELAVEAGESSEKIAKAASLITQTGKTLAQTEELLGHFIHLATVEGQDFERLAGILTDTMTALNMEVSQASELVDTLATISLATGIQEIDTAARAIGKASGAMNQFGVSVKDAGSTLGLLSKAFVISAGGIEAFTLVGNAMVDMVDGFGRAGLFTDTALEQMRKKLNLVQKDGDKMEVVFRMIRATMGDTTDKEALIGRLDSMSKMLGLNEAGMEGLRKIAQMSSKEFEHMSHVMKQTHVAQTNFNEIVQSAQRRIGALNTVVEQLKINFFLGMIEPLREPLKDFFVIIQDKKTNEMIKEIGHGFGSVLAPLARRALDVLEVLLTVLEKFGPEGRVFLGAMMAAGTGILIMLANIRLIVPVMKILQGLFGQGSQSALHLGRMFANIGRTIGIAGSSLRLFTRGMGMLAKIFAPLAVIISLFDILAISMKEGFGSASDWLKIGLDIATIFFTIGAMIPGPHSPFFAIIALVLALVNGFDLWKLAIIGVHDAIDSLGLTWLAKGWREMFPEQFGDLKPTYEEWSDPNSDYNKQTGKFTPQTINVQVNLDVTKNDSFATEE